MSKQKYRIGLLLDMENDIEIINRIESVNNKQGYIKQLILADIGVEYHEPKKGRGRKANDLTGKIFGKWTVINRARELDKPGQTVWICRCECGNEKPITAHALTSGMSKQCMECRKKQFDHWNDPRKRINGKPTKAYTTWNAIKTRCYTKGHKSYKYYGGRGIGMCDEWKNNYYAFYDYVSQLDRFGEEGMTIDRIDNEKGYEPGNIRWATMTEQNRNKRK